MPDDILDAAQKTIDNAANTADTPPVTPVASTTQATDPTPLPQEPAPPLPVADPPAEPTPVVPPPTELPKTDNTKEQLVSDLIGTTPTVEPTVVAPAPEQHKQSGGGLPKKKGKAGIIAIIAALLLTLPIAVYYISTQNETLTELRSRATGTLYEGCDKDNPNACGGRPELCHCQDGTACTRTACESPTQNYNSCFNQRRSWCESGFGNGYTCCVRGWTCCSQYDGCCEVGNPGDDDDTAPTNTPTPTTTITPICTDIKVYKNGTQVTNLATLRPGDAVVLAVKGNLAPTKAHFRVNGAAWTETATKNSSNEFTLNYTIPTGVTQFVIEGEVFTNGAWR